MAARDDGRDLVLVIDDDAGQRTLLTLSLRREGFAVAVAADGRTGLDTARAARGPAAAVPERSDPFPTVPHRSDR